MKLLWFVLSLMPAAFFFHYYEYGQHVRGEEAPFLLIGCIVFVIVTGFLAGQVQIKSVLLANILAGFLSVVLAMLFIPEDGWFKPVGRNGAVLFVGCVFLIGQLIVRAISKEMWRKKE